MKEIVEQSWDFCEQKAAAATDSGVEKKKRGRPPVREPSLHANAAA